MSEILRGKRKLTLKSAIRFATKLTLTQAEANHLYRLVLAQGMGEEVQTADSFILSEKEKAEYELSLDLFKIISEWFCSALIALTETKDFRWDEKWICKRLGISALEYRSALKRLLRVGMVEKRGRCFSVSKDFAIHPKGIPSDAVRAFHKKMLQKATHALDGQEVNEREITGLTFAVDAESMSEMKTEIQRFLSQMAQKYGKGRRLRSVYQLEVALFRLSETQIQ